MEFRYAEESKSWSEESDDRSEQNDEREGSGRSYECVFCKRGFTTAQALGGHMNIHRKDRANHKTKPKFSPSSTSNSTKVDDSTESFVDLGFYSAISGHPPHDQVELYHNHNYHQISFPAVPPITTPSYIQYSEVLCVENQRGLSLYGNLRQNKDKVQDSGGEGGLDLELRLGHHP